MTNELKEFIEWYKTRLQNIHTGQVKCIELDEQDQEFICYLEQHKGAARILEELLMTLDLTVAEFLIEKYGNQKQYVDMLNQGILETVDAE